MSSGDISLWEADSPSNVDTISIDLPSAEGAKTEGSVIEKAVEREPNIIVVDEKLSIEVHLLSDFPRGSEVLRLSTEEYFRRVLVKQEQGQLAIKCLRNRVKELKKQLFMQEQLLHREKEEAVSAVREFWRDDVLEGGSWGGKMLRAALNKKANK